MLPVQPRSTIPPATRRGWARLGLAGWLCLLAAATGCDFDQLVPPPPEQSILIDPSPDQLQAPWTLATPAGPLVSGAGDSTLTGMSPGNYTVTWGAVAGWLSPDPDVQTLPLPAGGSIAFRGTYQEIQQVPEFSLVPVPAGSFLMGSPEGEPGSGPDEQPQHEVTLTPEHGREHPFWIGTTEVTQAQYAAVMGENPSWFTGCDDCPVERVSWLDAIAFCNRLSELEGLTPAYVQEAGAYTWVDTADGYRLPTEAEWEYACRAGTATAFASGDISQLGCELDPSLDLAGWFCGNGDLTSQPVGGKNPNGWGLYDMHGNVWEWVWDRFGDYTAGAQTNPAGPPAGDFRVIRGGSWLYGAQRARSAYRHRAAPGSAAGDLGFRLARFVNPTPAARGKR